MAAITEGRAEGRAEGIAEGRREALREMILVVLTQRGLVVEPSHRARILAADSAELERWLTRVFTCANVRELFE